MLNIDWTSLDPTGNGLEAECSGNWPRPGLCSARIEHVVCSGYKRFVTFVLFVNFPAFFINKNDD